MPPIRHGKQRPAGQRIKLGDVVSFTHHDETTYGVVTSLVGGEVHVQHLVSTAFGPMRAHRRCSTPDSVKLTTLPSPKWVKEDGCLRHPLPGCDSCHHRDLRRRQRQLIFLDDGNAVKYRGEVYHIGELVFRRSETKGEPWAVGIVKDFKKDGIVVQDELCITPSRRTWLYVELRGKGVINLPTHLSLSYPCFKLEHRQREDGAIIPLQRPKGPCECIFAEARRTTALKELRPPAVGLYAGGGGSALGLSEHFELKLAVDTEDSCVQTLRANFPATRVLQREVGSLTAADIGEVSLLVAGPPCQAFTRANHNRKVDARGHEPARLLRLISQTLPQLVLIENVPGIKDRCGSDDVAWNAAEDVVRSLLGLGYQVRWAVLDAASYGAPQYRKRLFVLGAMTGTPLPRFPEPTHANARPASTIFLGEVFSSHDGTGAFPPVTAEQAVGDLPAWEYKLGGVYDPLKTEVGMRRCDVGPPRSRYAERLQRPDRRAREHLTVGCSADDYERCAHWKTSSS
ncbi:cytosine-specific methyltransferase [Trichosporon asahii var. asahii CBS 8904]|uniref:DNA (cytosine-5-)-methyltransferase n=1 Tax=Trichosporon asahii var. asahii (strain CBS 8904) TaxID=1220162 RepID=K1W551_TRIAC|nr:cytosine-specific methyltransferase [Trichosporon asahii var. asahii CBS 8904]